MMKNNLKRVVFGSTCMISSSIGLLIYFECFLTNPTKIPEFIQFIFLISQMTLWIYGIILNVKNLKLKD